MSFLKSLLQYTSPIDLIFLLVIFIFAIRGMLRGFIETVLNAAALLGGLVGGWFFYYSLSLNLQRIGIIKASQLAAFLIIFIGIYLAVKIIEHYVKRVTEEKSIDNLDKAAGFLTGAFQGFLLVVIFIIIVLNVIKQFNILNGYFDNSYVFQIVEKLFYKMFLKEGATIV